MISRRGVPDVVHSSDVVIVGSGVAGMMAALRARDRRVTIISKSNFAGGGSSVLAQGGVAAAMGPFDSPELHAADTIDAGAGLCREDVVRRVTSEAPQRLAELVQAGARFDHDEDGRLELGREAAHSRRRVVHAAGDATGHELVRALSNEIEHRESVTLVDRTLALELVVDDGRVVGLLAVDRTGQISLYAASAVVLATGGVGQVYRNTTNPIESTGDGLMMGSRAGARLAGLEFVQFHPTALDVGTSPMPLLTEALRGEGAVLIDETGIRFMESIHPMAELAPRDVVARAIWRHQVEGHATLLDATALADRLPGRFPTVVELCAEQNLDPRRQPIPVAPAVHYHMGGIEVDDEGQSTVPGLWACGEVAHTGLHGANRLASNSLLEALVYGGRIGDALAERPLRVAEPNRAMAALERADLPVRSRVWIDDRDTSTIDRIRDVMWRCVGLERSEAGLDRALVELGELAREGPAGRSELDNMLGVAWLITISARARTESRGAHYRRDIPWSDHHWRQDLFVESGRPLDPRPVAVAG
jgi:L-aspartate oxidase